ncbi:MAG TPA: ParB/RepB/Spo0J family partition protein [Spirochaetia bacterium]|nr:ParB/RepB/Spo0J family partition protein [Spirochaetia bacterium]
MSKRRLGKGIDALLQGRPLEEITNMASILMVDLEHISPNPDQPRKLFNDASLKELASSIREKGVIQPILAEDRGDGTYTIIAGERRYRAAKLAGLSEVPVISQDFTEDEKLEIALIENIQREDLNAMDEARALQSALEHSGITQEQLAKRLGKSRSAIANSVRLVKLEPEYQQAVLDGKISAGHARVLVGETDVNRRAELYERTVRDDLSVRQLERAQAGEAVGPADEAAAADGDHSLPGTEQRQERIRANSTGSPSITAEREQLEVPSTGQQKSVELRQIQDHLVHHLGTKVVIRGNDAQGWVEIRYHSTEDLERLLEAMGTRTPE